MAEYREYLKNLIAINDEYDDVRKGLSKSQDKELQNIIADERVQKYGLAGRMMNFADKATSIPVRGNTDIVIDNISDKLLYTTLAKQLIAQEAQAREGKAGGGSPLKGKQKKLDANKDGKISGEDFKILQDLEKRNPKFLGGIMKKLGIMKENVRSGKPKGMKGLFGNVYTKDNIESSGTGTEDAMTFLNPLPSYPNQLEVNQRPMMAEGGTMDDQMNALAISVSPAKIEAKEMNSEMLPDEEMEEEYVDYVVESTLDDEDKNYLNRALEKDAKLSEIFDQVVESATEFTGSGTVEGPGTGISDSIPARLSDGEFVFTAKATEEIGEDRLMSMMKEAEARADGRQDMANGGMVMEEEPIFRPQPQPTQQDIRVTKETVGAQASMREEEDLIGNELKKSMLSTAPYVRS
jgi:hypothetical protein